MRIRRSFVLRFALMAGSLGLAASPSPAQHGTKDGQWPAYGGDVGSTRYAPLDQINRDNFNDLKVVWTWDSPDALISKSEAGGEWRSATRIISEAYAAETAGLMPSE